LDFAGRREPEPMRGRATATTPERAHRPEGDSRAGGIVRFSRVGSGSKEIRSAQMSEENVNGNV
jgi:hypothetical protein